MNQYNLFSGTLDENDVSQLLIKICTEKLSGTLFLESDKSIELHVREGKIYFVSSDRPEDSLGQYLLDRTLIAEDEYESASEYSNLKNIRFGRALLELGLIGYETLWLQVEAHMKEIAVSVLKWEKGQYMFNTREEKSEENITLNIEIPLFLMDALRNKRLKPVGETKFESIGNIYPFQLDNLNPMELKAHETHVIELIKKESVLTEILSRSELLPQDTKQFIDLLIQFDVLTDDIGKASVVNGRKKPVVKKRIADDEKRSGSTAFISFEEALKYYNNKYELIFKVFSKEIGPIALSILQKNIKDVTENLPPYLQKIRWNSNGTIKSELLLKTMYHKDFQEHIQEFVKGLEEILYAGIYAIRKNVSPDKEKMVLKWINKPER